ncbi:MAG: hypothetical protein E6G29_00170, partial [Actinobacteria bacterium]
MVERHHRPCVLIALDSGRGRGSARSIGAFDLHAGLAACSGHLLRFGGHKAAAGLEIEAARVEAFREAFVRHAGSVLSPDDLVPVERVDAVVGPDRLGVAFAEELEKLRPFGQGNPAPTLLVPAARVHEVRGMGEDAEHSRFTIAGGGARARAVAFRVAASSLPESIEDRFDAAVRLELNEWNGAVEPRLVLRALCRTESGACRPIGAARPFSERLDAALGRPRRAAGPRPPRRGVRRRGRRLDLERRERGDRVRRRRAPAGGARGRGRRDRSGGVRRRRRRRRRGPLPGAHLLGRAGDRPGARRLLPAPGRARPAARRAGRGAPRGDPDRQGPSIAAQPSLCDGNAGKPGCRPSRLGSGRGGVRTGGRAAGSRPPPGRDLDVSPPARSGRAARRRAGGGAPWRRP